MVRIALIAPSGPVDPELLSAGRAALAERFGPLELVAAPNLSSRAGYLAGEDAARIAAVGWAFESSGATHVWFARGGFGATRILAEIPWARYARRAAAPVLLGYSDATAFLLAYAASGGRSLHAPMVAADLGRGGSPRSWESLGRLVFVAPEVAEDRFAFTGEWLAAVDELAGPALPANLAVLAALAGTPFFPSGRGRIICLEEVNEEPYRVDRLLTQLRAAGLFQGALAVAFGAMTDCLPEEPEKSFTLEEVLRRFAADTGMPVVTGLPFGHGGVNTVLPVGGWLRLVRGEVEISAVVRLIAES